MPKSDIPNMQSFMNYVCEKLTSSFFVNLFINNKVNRQNYGYRRARNIHWMDHSKMIVEINELFDMYHNVLPV